MKSFNWRQARDLCNLLEQEIIAKKANSMEVLEYVDFKETQTMKALDYGCKNESDRALFMYAMCIDYLHSLDFKLNAGKETLLNENYEVGKP